MVGSVKALVCVCVCYTDDGRSWWNASANDDDNDDNDVADKGTLKLTDVYITQCLCNAA